MPGYDAGKKIKGKKRHVLVDTLGLLLHAVVHPANVQDRDGAILVMADHVWDVSLSFRGCSPTVATRDRNSAPRWPKFARI